MAAERRLVLPDLAATRALGRRLARILRKGDLVALEGDLGAGKSELARAVIRARAGAAIEVPSPTFTLVQAYDLPGLRITHADLYRLAAADEVPELGLDEAVSLGALLVEWPERAGGLLPGERLTIRLFLPDPGEPGRREALLVGDVGWLDRLEALVA